MGFGELLDLLIKSLVDGCFLPLDYDNLRYVEICNVQEKINENFDLKIKFRANFLRMNFLY